MESLTEAIALLDSEGRVLVSNAALAQMSGYSAEEWRGQSLGRLFSRPGDPRPNADVLTQALREGVATGEAVGVRRDGSSLWLRYRITRLPASMVGHSVLGSPTPTLARARKKQEGEAAARPPSPIAPSDPCLLVVAEDVTGDAELRFAQNLSRQLLQEAGRREEMLTQLNRELAALNQLAATVNQSLDLETVLDAALDRALEVAEANTGWVFLLSPGDETELELVAHRGLPSEFVGLHSRRRVHECLPGKAVVTGKPLVLYSLPADEEMTPYLRQQDVRCVAHIPLRNRERAIGALGIGSAGIQKFSEGLVRFLTSVGHQVGLAIDNARLYEQVKDRADLDPLTGLYNRQRFCELLDAKVGVGTDEGEPADAGPNPEDSAPSAQNPTPWVLMIDIDNFKQINDTFGHDRGDQVLREVAQFLRENVRASDIAGRYGGDEFVVALCGHEAAGVGISDSRAEAIVDRLKIGFEEARPSGRFSAPLAVSIGGARSCVNSEHSLKLADDDMYREKRRRKRAAARSRGADKPAAGQGSTTGENGSGGDGVGLASGEPIAALRSCSARSS
jgi:diguanylate cyclase (GGDEF)-like protein/PAS domain S-box-containing protein